MEVLIPKVSMHAYYAGSWKAGGLHELEQGRTYTLNLHEESVRRDHPPAEFEEDKNLIINQCPDDADRTLRRLVLPRRPNQIHTLQCMTLEKSNFVHRDDAPFVEIPKKLVGLIHVLTFDLDGAEAPSIDELPKWQALPDIDSSIANLHVFADPPHAMTAMQNGQMSAESAALRHPTEAFNALLKLTSAEGVARGLKSSSHSARLKFQIPPSEFPLIEPSNPEVVRKLGLRQIELVSLSLSNLLPPDAYKTTMTDADTGTTPPHNCVSGVIICIPKN
jgi:hypothetical protein